jgi:hypothetical protein
MERHAYRHARGVAGLTAVVTRRHQALLAFFIMLAVVGIWGCNDDGSPVTPATVDKIQPLAVGNTWTFLDSTWTGSNVTVQHTTITNSATSTINYAGSSRDVYLWDVTTDGRLVERDLVRNESDGFWYYGQIDVPNDDTLIARTPWAMYPITVNDGFDEDRYTYDPTSQTYAKTATWHWTCLSRTEMIPVGGGVTKQGLVYWSKTNSTTEDRIYYIPNIGYAGWETRESGKVTFRSVMTGYTLK